MGGAAHNRGNSKQDYETPMSLIRAVEARFGKLAWDLAASETNAKAPLFITEEQNSFSVPWHELGGLLWLNPPFGGIAPWAKKCAESAKLGAKIAFLVPASVGANWYGEHIHKQHLVVFLNGRVDFIPGEGFPKDCMIVMFGEPPDFDFWTWRKHPVEVLGLTRQEPCEAEMTDKLLKSSRLRGGNDGQVDPERSLRMRDCGVCLYSGCEDLGDNGFWKRTATFKTGMECCECGAKIHPGVAHEQASWRNDDGKREWAHTCATCAEIAWAFSCDGSRLYLCLWDELREVHGDLTIGCLNKLKTPQAKAELMRRWQEWKGLAGE